MKKESDRLKGFKKTSKKLIVTHGSNYHPDDLFAVAVMSIFYKKIGQKFTLKRTLDPKFFEIADVVLDIGGIYNEKRDRFDHHQEGGAGVRSSGAPYAAFGLAWKKYGKKICGSTDIAEYVDKHLVAPLDCSDNGVDIYDVKNPEISPITIENYIEAECILEKNKTSKDQDFDDSFKKLIPFAERVIYLYIEKSKKHIESKKIIQKIYNKQKSKEIFVSDRFIPFDFEEFPQVLFYVYKDLRGNWSAKTIKKHPASYETRKSFPVSWRGKRDKDLADMTGVKDAIFCHNSGFLAVSRSKEGALELVRKALV